tara:strand:- start:90250 stop:91095 length:846 start_codon:yes stop_codon:yes gene_type:complete
MLKRKTILAAALVATIFLSAALPAYAVRVIPPRVVMKSGENLAYVYVQNSGDRPETYEFDWLQIAMTKNGDVVSVTDENRASLPDYRPADPYIRYSPRRTTIRPGETQRVTLFARRPPNMAEGEYRSHFLIRLLPDPISKAPVQGDADGARVASQVLVSRSFPVYMHHGSVQAKLNVTGVRFVTGERGKMSKTAPPYFVEVDIAKTGNRSVIGNIKVFCGDEPLHTVPRIFAVYAEADSRRERIVVDEKKARACRSARLVIEGHADDLLAGQVLADVTVPR